MELSTIRAVILFSVCSSSLLLTNKLLLAALPLPSTVSSAQFASTAVSVLVLQRMGIALPEQLLWTRVRQYIAYVLFFTGAVYANMQALREASVETLIVCRACCPLLVALLEWQFLGRELPSARSGAVICGLIAGAMGYVASDRNWEARGVAACECCETQSQPRLPDTTALPATITASVECFWGRDRDRNPTPRRPLGPCLLCLHLRL